MSEAGAILPPPPPVLSPDGSQVLIGGAWQPTTFSPDGNYYWDGVAWQPVPAGITPPTGPAVAVARDRGFYRNPVTTALLTLVGGSVFLLWWTFQLLAFARREGYPGSRNPWWILAPFYNLVLISRAFKGTHDAGLRAGLPALPLAAANLMYLGSLIAGNISGRVQASGPSLTFDFIGLVLGAAVVMVVQRHATALQQHERGTTQAPGAEWTWGMILALAIGLLFEGLVILAAFLP